ncbi:hypothetical protein JQ628_11275 [Bradyrhizobium lablabi]|nr:hypothetical protein [Bradyrhizobium lablabi]MBR1122097.1 hypothetical protein [Bradyrhizobium lablabi]
MFTFALGFLAGGALIWFAREPVTIWYKGVEDYVGALNDKINKLKS